MTDPKPADAALTPDNATAVTTANSSDSDISNYMEVEDFDELDAILDEMRTRYDETPQWEFCEGFMAAVICARRPVPKAEYLEALLGIAVSGESGETDQARPADEEEESGSFADAAQRSRFMILWKQRWSEVATALDSSVDSLEDERCYHPEVMDIRGAVADMPPEEQTAFKGEDLPAFAQVWALGFMFAVEYWPEDWAAPRDKDAAKWLDGALLAIVAMSEDDSGTPEVSPLNEEGAPSTSIARLNAFGEAIWAVYDLRELWKTIGPKVETVRAAITPGRNDPCFCGSGKKYKKCHGAG